MESVLMEERGMNPRRSLAVLNHSSSNNNNNNYYSNMYGGFLYKRPQNYPLPSPSSISSLSHLFLNVSSGSSYGSYGYPRPPPTYTSLPTLSLQQPPLLPLPYPTKKITASASAAAATVRSRQNQKKKKQPRPSAGPRKEPRSYKTDPSKLVEKTPVAEEEEEEEEEFVMGSVYSLSPPPSSLPLPKFSLTKPKVAGTAASCVAEAMVGVDAGATDDLRRLLRL